jgi:transposase
MARMFLRDSDWERLEKLLPAQAGKRGRPRKNDRLVIEGILWILRTGAPWRDIPKEFGPWTTIANRYRRWTISGVWERMWGVLKKRCRQRISYGGLDNYQGTSAWDEMWSQQNAGGDRENSWRMGDKNPRDCGWVRLPDRL